LATKIQLRRDTSTNWISNNPILSSGEIGIETDTLKFKIGNGSNWNSITKYANVTPEGLENSLGDFIPLAEKGVEDGVATLDADGNLIIPGLTTNNYEVTLAVNPTADRTINLPDNSGTIALTSDITTAVTNLVDGAPGLLDTLNELAAAVNDDPSFFTSVATNLSNHENDTTNIHGISNTANLVYTNDSRLSDTRTPTDNTVSTDKIVNSAVTTDKINNGAVTSEKIANGTIVNADISSSAEIDKGKISGTAITAADLGTVTNAMLAGSIQNNKLENNSVTINGYEIHLGSAASYSTDNIDEGTTNKYYTDNRAKDAAGYILENSTQSNISISYDEANRQLTITAENGVADSTTDDLDEGTTNKYFTEQRVWDSLNGGDGITLGATGDISADLGTGLEIISGQIVVDRDTVDTWYDAAGSASSEVSTHDGYSSNVHGINGNVVGTSDIQTLTNKTINGGDNTLQNIPNNALDNDSITVNGYSIALGSSVTLNTDDVQETLTPTNKYFTEQRARDSISAGNGISYDSNSGSISIDTNATVDLNTSQILTNKEIDLADNNLSGTVAEFNTALSDGDFATIDGAETLTNKTLTSPHIDNPTGLTKSDVGLSDVDNTSDADKPISTATQNALDDKLDLAGGTMTGFLTLSATPENDLHAATKAYVDAATTGLNVHDAVRVATTESKTLASDFENGDVIDGITLVTGDRILIKNQSTKSENGIYIVEATGAPTRASDYNSITEIDAGDFVFVQLGSINGKTGWVQTNIVSTIGSDNIEFTQFSGAGTYTAGTGLTLSGSQFNIDTATTVDKTTAQTLSNKTISYSDNTITVQVANVSDLTASASELNTLDGITASTAELNTLDGITSSTTELNILTGATVSASELNILDGATLSTSELNTLDGITASTAELNILDGVTASASEINILDGATLTTTELNYVDGVTSSIQTQLNDKATSTDLTNHINDLSTHGVSGDIVGTTDTQTLSNKTISGGTINEPSIKLSQTNPSIGWTGVGKSIFFPSYTGSSIYIADTESNQTLLNKTISGGTLNNTNILSSTLSGSTINNATVSGGTFTDPTIVASSKTISATEISYLDGAQSNIQTQLDGKAVYPTQSGNNGKYLTTDGLDVSWQSVDALPTQSGNSGKYLTTNGSSASWANPFVAVTNQDPSNPADGQIYFNYENFTLNVAYGGIWFVMSSASVEAGSPSTTSFDSIVDGGAPNTSSFSFTMDAGALS